MKIPFQNLTDLDISQTIKTLENVLFIGGDKRDRKRLEALKREKQRREKENKRIWDL